MTGFVLAQGKTFKEFYDGIKLTMINEVSTEKRILNSANIDKDPEIIKLKEKYSHTVNKSIWDDGNFNVFASQYKDEIVTIVNEYLKVMVDGIYVLVGIEQNKMPCQKEPLQSIYKESSRFRNRIVPESGSYIHK